MPDPQMIGPYRLERVLGTGSFATVWLARDDVLDRNVAVKILADNWSRDNEVRRRFLAEARVLLTVESPRIVRGFHLGEASTGQPYLVMAWADRGTIGDRLEQRRSEGRTFDTHEVVGIATEVAYALVDTSERAATTVSEGPTESGGPDSVTTDLGRPISTGARDAAETDATGSEAISADPTVSGGSSAPTVPAATVLEPIEPTGPTTTGWGQLAGQLALPQLVHVEGKLNDDLDPERQVGTTILTPGEFVADLVELNSRWTGGPGEPEADGSLRFEMQGPDRTATVVVSVLNLTTGDDIVVSAFEIEYQ